MSHSFQTYFPHIDNIYSHRSTQRHKRKRFASHYWDCRLKGRPAGTQKSTDPDKKKRKRVARMRNLCDVKIKITEYFDSAELTDETGLQPPGEPYGQTAHGGQYYSQNNGGAWPSAPPGMSVRAVSSIAGRPRKFYTIQRVNGNGGNGRGDGVAGPHKHTIEESDRVKKNSVQRWVIKNELEKKKAQVCPLSFRWLRFFSVCDTLVSPLHSLIARIRFIAAMSCCMMTAAGTCGNHVHHVIAIRVAVVCSRVWRIVLKNIYICLLPIIMNFINIPYHTSFCHS